MLFKRSNKPVIPPVEPTPPKPASSERPFASNSSLYERRSVPDAGPSKVDQQRRELLGGYDPSKRSKAFDEGLPKEFPEEGNDEDVEGIKQQTRILKEEGVTSTRNALRFAREAEETARGTLGRLGEQSEKLADTERHLDVAKGHTLRADDQISELKQLNKSIFRPAITFNKDAKRRKQEAEMLKRYECEQEERSKTLLETQETQRRVKSVLNGVEEKSGVNRRNPLARKGYQFEQTASDDELEDELDDNLDEISDIAKNLKKVGIAMGRELDAQNQRLENIDEKTKVLDQGVFRQTERLKGIR